MGDGDSPSFSGGLHERKIVALRHICVALSLTIRLTVRYITKIEDFRRSGTAGLSFGLSNSLLNLTIEK